MTSMQDPRRSIYRDKALSHHWRRKDKPVLPHFFAYQPSICRYWLFFLLLCSIWFLWYARMPAYVEGSAIIVNEDRSIGQREKSTIIVLFPPKYLDKVRVGHALFLQNSPAGDR